MRRDIEFNAEGLTLRGWFYVPDGAKKPVPTIVMAHGFSCTKEMFLDKYAEVFVKDGLAVLIYDNRNFGDSDGQPRLEVDPYNQIRDYRHAITYASSLPEVDSSRIGIWGTSYTGGHVLQVQVTLRSLEMFLEHDALSYADKIGPVPLLMIVEDEDTLAAVDLSLDGYNRAQEPREIVFFHGGHFDAYVRDQAVTARAASDWYVKHLIKDPMSGGQ